VVNGFAGRHDFTFCVRVMALWFFDLELVCLVLLLCVLPKSRELFDDDLELLENDRGLLGESLGFFDEDVYQ
jgi:hypothetical protein